MQKESTVRDSFDLFSGLFVHNRFAQQEVWTILAYFFFKMIFDTINPSLSLVDLIKNLLIMQLQNLELALNKVKQKLVEKMGEEEQD